MKIEGRAQERPAGFMADDDDRPARLPAANEELSDAGELGRFADETPIDIALEGGPIVLAARLTQIVPDSVFGFRGARGDQRFLERRLVEQPVEANDRVVEVDAHFHAKA